jgi:hypothetical protein
MITRAAHLERDPVCHNALNEMVNACLRRQRLPTVHLGLDFVSSATA